MLDEAPYFGWWFVVILVIGMSLFGAISLLYGSSPSVSLDEAYALHDRLLFCTLSFGVVDASLFSGETLLSKTCFFSSRAFTQFMAYDLDIRSSEGNLSSTEGSRSLLEQCQFELDSDIEFVQEDFSCFRMYHDVLVQNSTGTIPAVLSLTVVVSDHGGPFVTREDSHA